MTRAATLARLPEAAATLQFPEETVYYEIEVDGKPVGYLTRQLSREQRALDTPSGGRSRGGRKEGLRVRERSWRFTTDGGATYTRTDLFASFDQKSELIEQEQTVVPSPTAAVPQPVTSMDQVIREDENDVRLLRGERGMAKEQ